MKTNSKRITAFFGALAATSLACADNFTGTIHSLHVNLETGWAHVQLAGAPTFTSGPSGTCSAIWTANALSDEQFMLYIWPLLVSAKMHGKAVTISTNGCNSIFPKIRSIDVEPRIG